MNVVIKDGMFMFIVIVRPGCILTLLKVSECSLVDHATIKTNKTLSHDWGTL